MSTQNKTENYTNEGMIQIPCTATKGELLANPQPEGDKQPVTPIINTDSVVIQRDNTVSFDLYVDVDSEYPSIPTLWINPETKEFYVEYDYTEEWAPQLYKWHIQGTYDNVNGKGAQVLSVGDEVTFYNRDIDPITSSGKKATVQPST